MNINIFIHVENNKIKFKLNLPFFLFEKNDDGFLMLDNKTIYETDNLNIDYEYLNKQLKLLSERIKNSFFSDEPSANNIVFNNLFIMDDETFEDKSLAYNFIKNNKNFHIELNVRNFKDLVDYLKDDNYPNLMICFKNSDEIITYKSFYQMYSKLIEIIEFIKHYNLSTLEKVMLAYDIVKANKYKKENNNEEYGISRNLNEIVNNDKIVCVGFSNLIDFILNNLGIVCNTITLGYKDKQTGHERNYVHIKDDKYNINGIFFLDATWDSKNNDNYLDNYNYFLKPLFLFKLRNKNEYVISPKIFDVFLEHDSYNLLSHIKNELKNNPIQMSFVITRLLEKYKDNVNFPIFIDFQSMSDKELELLVKELENKYYKSISKEAFKNALYKVRKIEYMNKIIEYIPTEEYINNVCDKYCARSKLFEKLFGPLPEVTLDKDLEEANANTVNEDLLRIRLLRSIKEKLKDFPENDYIKKM